MLSRSSRSPLLLLTTKFRIPLQTDFFLSLRSSHSPSQPFFPSIAFPRLGEKVNKHTFSLTTNYLPSLAAEGNAFVGEVEEEEEDQEGKEG